MRWLQAAWPRRRSASSTTCGLEQLCIARVYLAPMDGFAEFNAVWERQFATIAPPARTSIGAAALPLGAAVEIEFVFHE